MVIYRSTLPNPVDASVWLNYLGREIDELHHLVWHENPGWVWHRHNLTEVLVIVKGQLLLQLPQKTILLHPGDRVEIPPHTTHRYEITNPPCEVIFGYRI